LGSRRCDPENAHLRILRSLPALSVLLCVRVASSLHVHVNSQQSPVCTAKIAPRLAFSAPESHLPSVEGKARRHPWIMNDRREHMFSRFQGSTPRNEVAGASLMEQNLLDASHLHFYRVVLQRGDTIPCESSQVCVRSRWFAKCLFLPSLSSYCIFCGITGHPVKKGRCKRSSLQLLLR
jgi:hypothetical protein